MLLIGIMNTQNPEPDASSASRRGGGVLSFGQGPWIVAAAIIAAAVIVSVTLIAVRGTGDAVASAPTDGEASVVTSAVEDARIRAEDRAAQSDLRNALVTAKVMYTDDRTYLRADSSPTGLATVEPSLCYVDANTESSPMASFCDDPPISVYASDGTWAAARRSNSGMCFWIRDDLVEGTTYGEGDPCTGTAALGASSGSWSSS